MKNTQVAILCASVIAGSLIVAGTNVWLVHSLGRGSVDVVASVATGHRPVIAVMPKAKGDPYFRQRSRAAPKTLRGNWAWN